MTLTYQTTLEDRAQVSIRHFLRSKTTPGYRKRSALYGAITGTAVCLVVLQDHGWEIKGMAALVGGMLVAAINYWFYYPTVRRRIRKNLQRNHGHIFPCEVIYVIDAGQLRCEMPGSTIIFRAEDLEKVSEDAQWLEMIFRGGGLSVIPLGAFRDEAEKARFLEALGVNEVGRFGPSAASA